MKYFIIIDQETHCEDCGEVVHNHISKCPICLNDNTPTDQYCDLDHFKETEIMCCKCNSVFKLLGEMWYEIDYDAGHIPQAVEVELIK